MRPKNCILAQSWEAMLKDLHTRFLQMLVLILMKGFSLMTVC